MKKLIALVMAVMMAFGATGALAATDYSTGYTMDVKVNVNKELASGIINMMLMGEGVTPEVVSGVLDVVNLAGLHVATDTKNVEVVAKLNEQPMVNFQGTVNENSILMATDMLPSYAISLDQATMKEMGMELPQNVDMAAAQQAEKELAAALEKVVADAVSSLNATVISQQPTELPYNEEVVFNYETIVSIPAKDAAEALRNVLTQVIDLLGNYMAASGTQMPEGMDLESLKAELAQLQADENAAPIIISEYVIMEGETAREGYSYNMVMVEDETESVYVALAELGNTAEIGVYVGSGEPEQIAEAAYTGAAEAVVMEITAVEGENAEDAQAMITFVTSGMLIGAYVESKAVAEGGSDMLVELYFLTDQAPMATLNISVRPLTAELAPVDVTGKTVITMADLQGENAANVEQALSVEAQQSVNGLLVKAVTAAPEQVQALMDAISALMVQPEAEVVAE